MYRIKEVIVLATPVALLLRIVDEIFIKNCNKNNCEKLTKKAPTIAFFQTLKA